jgi:hypothetical protein
VAPHVGWGYSADSFGLLSALTLVWTYEHRYCNDKLDRMRDQIDHVFERLARYDRH